MTKLIESRLFRTVWGQRYLTLLTASALIGLFLYELKPNKLTPIIALIISSIPVIPMLVRAYKADKKKPVLLQIINRD